MGRPKLPEKIKQMRGTQRKCREIDDEAFDGTLVTTLKDVKAPAHLSADAKKVYKAIVSQLFAMNMLQPIDEPALCIFANAIVTISKMQKELDRDGYVTYVRDEDGNISSVMVNPMQKVLKDAINTANTIGSQFGWSPTSRIRLTAMLTSEKENKDDFADFTNE
jgi:P27 family predicted phage terminase small subunit